ncbi:pyridoxal-phosphate dependent enzyme [uncultured Clostridium sp.]|uniref:pyridoxal-phosphate dependent enzyme n=1 Tax=uncultured Clostridium sp. TaxID=59620 RepID=UPI0026EA5F7C|nr:pyridoxal-phosphate dependent enzyme [uncultured Clostridium sp.]
MTEVQKVGNLYFKRDDLFEYGGMKGAKVRAAKILCEKAKAEGYTTVTSLGAKSSPQINILASVCRELGLNAVGHTTNAELQYDMLQAISKGADVIQHPYGYTNVLVKRAREYAVNNNAYYLPFGMDDIESVYATTQEVESILPYINDIKRVVIVVGSGINLAGLVKGFIKHKIHVPILGIEVGSVAYKKILEKYIGDKVWQKYCTIEKALQPYNSYAEYTNINGIDVDSTYEGKCLPFLKKGDLFWIIGKKEHWHQGKSMTI